MTNALQAVSSNDVATSAPSAINPVAGNLAVDGNRQVAEVLAMVHVARNSPRDVDRAITNIRKDCSRKGLAQKATYAYPRGDQRVTGPSIRLAEALAQRWGNIECGVRELERREGVSVMQSFAWDLETNYRVTKNFEVPHKRDTKNGSYAVKDARDIYELTANMASRRLRACILQVIPGDVVEAAVEACAETLSSGKTPVGEIINGLAKMQVTAADIEARYGCKVERLSGRDIADLTGVYNAMREGIGNRSDYFNGGKSSKPRVTAAQVVVSEPTRSVQAGILQDHATRTGEKNGKQWTAHDFKIDGVTYGTMDGNLAAQAELLMGQPVEFTSETNGKFYKLTSITAGSPVEVEAADE